MTITENTIELAERSTRVSMPTDSERAAVKALCIAARKYEERIKLLEEELRGRGNIPKGGGLDDICFCGTFDTRTKEHTGNCHRARKALGIETRTA